MPSPFLATDNFTLDEMIAEVKLELKFRFSTYAKMVNEGRMRQDVADFRTARMQAVLDRLLADREREDRQGDLFLEEQPGHQPAQEGRPEQG